jgi:hypothetical protein
MIMSGFISSCVCYWMSTKKVTKNSSAKKGEKDMWSSFLQTHLNYFSLLNLKSLIERFGSLRNLWEGEWENFIKYIKAEMNTLCDTKTFMSSVLKSLLCTCCLDNFTKNNQYYEDTKLSKTRDLKLCKSREAFEEDFLLEKCCWVLLSRCQRVMRIYMFAMKKRFELVCVGEGKIQWWQGMLKIQSILCSCFVFKKGRQWAVFVILWGPGWDT